jgi:hypothetical protein
MVRILSGMPGAALVTAPGIALASGGKPSVFLYGATLLFGAFLLFLVQPILGKSILPWFGGVPAVWTVCMLFFQLLLLAGYWYAHILVTRLHPRRQAMVHLAIMAASLATLPILPSSLWKPAADSFPLIRILGLLMVCVGAPYFVLSSASPLLQGWFSYDRPGISPYRLYALSNLGSLLAILVYAPIIESALPLGHQAALWSWSYAAFALLCGACAWGRIRHSGHAGTSAELLDQAPSPFPIEEAPRKVHRALWLALPACSSVMLLATTNQLCLDVAVIPFLWVLPLGLYLFSYALCFYSSRTYSRLWIGILLAASFAWSCSVLSRTVFVGIISQITSYSLTLLAACMVCHGELVRLKPDARHLTSFYGAIGAGGALGAILVTFLAPAIFKGYWEYPLGMIATAALFMAALYLDRKSLPQRGTRIAAWIVISTAFLALAASLGNYLELASTGNMEMSRNFFGVLRVFEEDKGDPRFHRVVLMHGRIQHGFQYQAPFRRNWPTSYYGPTSGIGLALRYHPLRRNSSAVSAGVRIGVVGLGIGTLASYGRQGDTIRFYEINPEVTRLARQYFTFIRDSSARVEMVQGDARISLEREKQQGKSQQFDVLAVDAFNGDAVPVHLLTRECMDVYRSHLKPDGILALHISCKYFDLSPAVRGLAAVLPEFTAMRVLSPRDRALGIETSEWVLLSANRQFLETPEVLEVVRPWTRQDPPPQLWTDDSNSLLRLLRRP